MPQKILLPGLEAYEQPVVSGAPARPIHPPWTRGLYIIIGICTGLLSGIQIGLVSAGADAIIAEHNLTTVQMQWLTVIWLMMLIWLSPILLKWRENYGIMPYVRWVCVLLVVTNLVQFYGEGFAPQLIGRALAGLLAGGLIACAVYFCMQGVPNPLTIAGVMIGTSTLQIANPMGKWIGAIVLYHDGMASNLMLFHIGLSLIVLAGMMYLSIPPTFKKPTFQWLDIPSYGIWMVSTASLAGFFGIGIIVWWDTPWLGIMLLIGLTGVFLAIVMESLRRRPTFFPHWILSPGMLKFFALSFLLRAVLGEQLVGTAGFLSAMGYTTDQLITYYGLQTLGAVLGLIAALATLRPPDLRYQVLLALLIVAIASFIDTGAGEFSTPSDFYFTQAAVAFAMLYFYGPLFLEGLGRGLSQGTAYVIGFVVVFSVSQGLGALAGAGAYGTFLVYRVKTHLISMGAESQLSDPIVVAQLQKLAAGQPASLVSATDRLEPAGEEAVSNFVLEAVILAFNELFYVSGCIAVVAILFYGAPWLFLKLQGRTSLDEVFERALTQAEINENAG